MTNPGREVLDHGVAAEDGLGEHPQRQQPREHGEVAAEGSAQHRQHRGHNGDHADGP